MPPAERATRARRRKPRRPASTSAPTPAPRSDIVSGGYTEPSRPSGTAAPRSDIVSGGYTSRRKPSRSAPITDVQMSGPNYGGRRKTSRGAAASTSGTRAPITDVRMSGEDYGHGNAFGLRSPFSRLLATVPFNPDRELGISALANLRAGRPFNAEDIRSALDWGLADDDVEIDDKGTVQLRTRKRSVLGVDSALNDLWAPINPETGKPFPLEELTELYKQSGIESAGLKVLEQTTRPLHAIAGATDSLVRGESVGKALDAAGEGLIENKSVTFSDVLKSAGAPGWLAVGGGLVLDIGLDPTTYVSLGSTVPGKLAARKAGEKAAAKVAARGATREGAENIARIVERRNPGQAPMNAGWTFGLRGFGKEIKTSGRGTAAVSRALRVPQAAKAARDTTLVQAVGRAVNPDFRPAGIPKDAFDAVRDARRTARAAEVHGTRRAQQRGIALLKALKPAEYRTVIDAVEAGTFKSLTPELAKVAKVVRDDYRYINRLERRAGIAGRPLADYFPHIPPTELERLKGARTTRTGRAAKLDSSRRRKIRKPLSQLRLEDPSLFSENVPLVHATRLANSSRGVVDAQYLAAVAKTGRKLDPEAQIDTATEAIYKVTPTDITKISESRGRLDTKAIEKALDDGDGYVILNKALADEALRAISPREGTVAAAGRGWDRAQSPVKTALTVPNPQYHFTNLFGDTFNAYLGDVRVKDFVSSWRGMSKMLRREKAAKTLDKIVDKRGRGLKIGGKRISYSKLLDEAESEGAIRTGFISRDLPELIDAQHELAVRLGQGQVAKRTGPAGRVARQIHPIRAMRDASQYREDFVRLASFIGARRRGMSPAAAAQHVNKHHFDYCVDEETEVLTTRGWLRFDEVQVGDQALGLDPTTRQIVWSEISAVNVFDSPGHIEHWTSTTFDAMTTANHRWLAESSGVRGGPVSSRTATEHFTTTEEAAGSHKRLVTGGGRPLSSDGLLLSDELVELIGWYVTEGTTLPGNVGVIISQSIKHNPEYVERIRRLAQFFADQAAKTTEYKPRDCGHGLIATFYFGEGIGDVLRDLCPGKQLPLPLLTGITASQRKLLFDTMLAADGHITKRGVESFAQKDSGRIDSFVALCAMLGRRTRVHSKGGGIDCSNVTVYRTGTTYSDQLKKQRVAYDGKIWCPTTETGTWMARRCGTTFWTGNSDLTEFERGVLRRAFPFWTFTARNVPLQAKMLVKRPGKFATLQKVREEGQRAAGLPDDYEEQLPGYDQRGLPVPLPDGLGLLFPKLPATDLNRLPGNTLSALMRADPGRLPGALSADAGDAFDQTLAMLTPLAKTPLELGLNYQTFFREPLDRRAAATEGRVHDTIRAPGFVDDLPGPLQDLFGVSEIVDRRSGEKVPGWSPKAAYAFGLLPFTATATQLATEGPSPRGSDGDRKLLGYLTGLKTKPFDPVENQIREAYEQRSELEARMEQMRDEGRSKRRDGGYRKDYAKLLAENRKINRKLYKLLRARGDKILPTSGAPKKPAGAGGGAYGGGGYGSAYGGSGYGG